MSRRLRRFMIGIAASMVIMGGITLVCCTRTTSPGLSPTAPPSVVEEPSTSSKPEQDSTEGEGAPQPEIDVLTDTAEPEPPSYVAVVDQYEAGRPGRVRAAITAPNKLELETRNVKRLRITREGLPLPRDRSIVLRIDGQGIEWTRDYLAVELERSPAGVWEVTHLRPAKP